MDEKKTVKFKLERHKWPDEIEAEKMERNKRLRMILLCIACFLGGILFSNHNTLSLGGNKGELDKISQIYEILLNQWYFGKDIDDLDRKLIDQSINGMVDGGGDIHTVYMDAQTANDFTSSLEGNFVGIGIQFYAVNSNIFIVDKVFPNSPAQEAGILKGDQIYKINGIVCENMTSDDVADLVRGDEGSIVSIEIIREGNIITMEVSRREVSNSVFGEVKDGVGVMEIYSFSETSGYEVGNYLKEFKNQNVQKLIIDLRDNGGGYLNAVRDIASYFLSEDTVIFHEENKKGEVKEYRTLKSHDQYSFENIVLLINQNTASASEVLAAALKEYLNVTIVGVKSYGKGTVQVPLTFKDGSILKYTTAQWLTASGNKINGVGITPDYEVNLDEALTIKVPQLYEEVYEADTVSVVAKSVQIYLKFLGYEVDRRDEYFSITSSQALRMYQADMGLEVNGNINDEVVASLLSSCAKKWHEEKSTLDVQMKKAMEVIHGR